MGSGAKVRDMSSSSTLLAYRDIGGKEGVRSFDFFVFPP